MRYLISVSYDGSKLYGFERQPNKLTVQGELERVLSKIAKKEVLIKGAGRTDRGVHARDQKAHFDLDIDIKPEGLKRAMNSMLDSSIYVNYAKVVNDDFHARFDVSKKIYEYKINLGEYDPIINSFCYNYNRKLIKLRNYFIKEITTKYKDAKVNGDLKQRLPGNINISFPNIDGEELLLKLDSQGICASAGSACSSGIPEPSHVLNAIGLERRYIRGNSSYNFGRRK